MKRVWLIWIVGAVLVAAAAHFTFMMAYPNLLMSVAMKRLSRDGAAENVWMHSPRMTEDVRIIVRPSPDLAYSSCVFNLSAAPVRFAIEPWGDYMSLSLFAANTDNFFTLNDRRMPPEGGVVILHRRGQAVAPEAAVGAIAVVESPSTRGIALIRRLAPTPERFAAAEAARGREACEAVAE